MSPELSLSELLISSYFRRISQDLTYKRMIRIKIMRHDIRLYSTSLGQNSSTSSKGKPGECLEVSLHPDRNNHHPPDRGPCIVVFITTVTKERRLSVC